MGKKIHKKVSGDYIWIGSWEPAFLIYSSHCCDSPVDLSSSMCLPFLDMYVLSKYMSGLHSHNM
jgi:hypothetical protein